MSRFGIKSDWKPPVNLINGKPIEECEEGEKVVFFTSIADGFELELIQPDPKHQPTLQIERNNENASE